MEMMKKIIWFALFILVAGSFIALFSYWRTKDKICQVLFDIYNPQSPVTTKTQIDRLLQQFETISFNKLDKSYLKAIRYSILIR